MFEFLKRLFSHSDKSSNTSNAVGLSAETSSNIYNSSFPKCTGVIPVNEKTVDIRTEEERLHDLEVEKFRLSEDEINRIVSIIDDPELPMPVMKGNPNYFDSDGYFNKEEKYIDKCEELQDDLCDLYELKKIESTVSKLQQVLVKFKTFMYSKGTSGVDEYRAIHDMDFIDARDGIKLFLLDDYPHNIYNYTEEQKEIAEQQERIKEEKADKKTILTTVKHEPIAQAELIKMLFPGRNSYGKRLCNALVKEGKLQRVKQSNKYFVSKV